MLYLLIILFFALGLAVGSFLNVVAYRTVHGGSVFLGSSVCPRCKHKLTPLDLIPIVSFLLLAGKCRYCGKKISLQYPLVEVTTGILFVFTFLYWLNTAYSIQHTLFVLTSLIYLLFVVSVLIVLFVTDILDGVLPNSVVLPAIAFVLILKSIFLVNGDITLSSLIIDVAAAIVVASAFFTIVYFSNEKAMGGGDVKLAFLVSLVVGWPATILALFVSFLTGAFVAVMLILLGKKRFGQTVPFGPFLVIGAFLALFWGREIIEIYLRFLYT